MSHLSARNDERRSARASERLGPASTSIAVRSSRAAESIEPWARSTSAHPAWRRHATSGAVRSPRRATPARYSESAVAIRLTLVEGLSAERLRDRTQLLADFDGIRRDLDANGGMEALDRFTQQAVSILTSGRFADAL